MERRFELRRIPIWPAVRVSFVVLLVIGVVFAVFYGIMFSGLGIVARMFGDSPIGSEFGIFRNFGFVMIPLIAITYAFFGTIGVVLWCLVYNFVAAVVGGIELGLGEKKAVGLPPLPAGGGSPSAPESVDRTERDSGPDRGWPRD